MDFAQKFAVLFLAWLAFTYSLAPSEIIIGALCSATAAYISGKLSFAGHNGAGSSRINPRNFLKFMPFFISAEISSHLSVAKAVITGRISPAIMRVDSGITSSGAKTFLSGSITLTPGTLSVDVGEGGPLYIHYLDSRGGTGTEQKFAGFAEKIFGGGSA